MLKSEGIYKSYGALQVLRGIDIEIEKSEIVSITGASGAGKSTLLHILGLLDEPDKGTVIINDTNIRALSRKKKSAFRNRHLGFVFQFHNLLPEFTAMENVCIPGYIGKRPDKEVKHEAMRLLDLLKIADRAGHKPSQLSGGEQQRVAVARALINNPTVVFADEPSGNLDSATARDLHQLFFDLRRDLGQTFVIVTHNEELANMADRKLHMKDGLLL